MASGKAPKLRLAFLLASAFAALLVIAGAAYFAFGNRQSSPSPYAKSVGTLKAVTGLAPTVVPLGDSWQAYRNDEVGLTFRYPPGWKYVQDPERPLVVLYPPDANPNRPSALVSFDFAADRVYQAKVTSPADASRPVQKTVAGISGQQYEDIEFAVPTQAYYVELPYRGGTLLISATKGPAVNLVPVLEQILKTVVLKP